MGNFDADVKTMTVRYQCENRYTQSKCIVCEVGGSDCLPMEAQLLTHVHSFRSCDARMLHEMKSLSVTKTEQC